MSFVLHMSVGFPEDGRRHIGLGLRRQIWPESKDLGVLSLKEYRVRPEKDHPELLKRVTSIVR
jgi:hypothetical protein